jgi:hypothetical protein
MRSSTSRSSHFIPFRRVAAGPTVGIPLHIKHDSWFHKQASQQNGIIALGDIIAESCVRDLIVIRPADGFKWIFFDTNEIDNAEFDPMILSLRVAMTLRNNVNCNNMIFQTVKAHAIIDLEKVNNNPIETTIII